jgi:hypothetical protein
MKEYQILDKRKWRIRFPRTFRYDGAIIPYYAPAAFSMHVLYNINDAEYFKAGECPVIHIPNEDNTELYMVTNQALMAIALKDNDLIWRFLLTEISVLDIRADKEGRNVLVVTALYKRKKWKNAKMVSKRIFNPNKSQLELFYKQLLQIIERAKQNETRHPAAHLQALVTQQPMAH